MPGDESVLVVPLRSNAHTLLAGAPVAAMRRRLKFASLFFDKLYLEAGVFRMDAGPTGYFDTLEPARDGTRWQTAAQRSAAQASSFGLAMGREIVPGTPAPTMHTVMASETSRSWVATLDPFGDELPAGCDWVEWVRSPRQLSSELDRIVRDWTWADEHNAALERAISERLLRGAVIKNTNHDLVIAAASHVAATVDTFHAEVAAQRFNDDESWRLRGYAVPIIFPNVGYLPWEAIADFRRDRGMARFREVLREVEQQATAEAADGDIEAAANRIYRRRLVEASEAIDTLGTHQSQDADRVRHRRCRRLPGLGHHWSARHRGRRSDRRGPRHCPRRPRHDPATSSKRLGLTIQLDRQISMTCVDPWPHADGHSAM
ncbi:MAG: hypothetical protein ACLQB1_44420 [Streptosporangiaceae bacterium]